MQDIERLNYRKPPPGSEWVGGGRYVKVGDEWVMGFAAAWSLHKERHDPPGLCVRPWVVGWCFDLAPKDASPRLARALALPDVDGLPFASPTAARAAAWTWHDERLALAERSWVSCRCVVPRPPTWPDILTWSDADVAAVERWLVDSTAEMPEVLRG